MFNFFNKTDAEIQKDVTNELSWDPSIKHDHIDVSVKDGVVSLNGKVPHYSEKWNAVQAAQRVGGVRAVADELQVNLMGSYSRTDEDIAKAAIHAKEWNYSVPNDIKITVEKGWITLSGDADWYYQKTAAKKAMSDLIGVIGVTNNINIRNQQKPLAADVKTNIEDALKRSAVSEGRKIAVTIKDNKVILTGQLQSLSEINDARKAAWKAPGVLSVQSDLTVS